MNERIRELALRAGIEFVLWDDSGRPMIGNYTPEERLAKFAELIVAECAQVCKNEGASYEEKAAGAYQSNLYVTAIKKHFGVEE
jgi:hypothetical protein